MIADLYPLSEELKTKYNTLGERIGQLEADTGEVNIPFKRSTELKDFSFLVKVRVTLYVLPTCEVVKVIHSQSL